MEGRGREEVQVDNDVDEGDCLLPVNPLTTTNYQSRRKIILTARKTSSLDLRISMRLQVGLRLWLEDAES